MADLTDRLQRALGATYRIERELPGGGMSRVFLATEVHLARAVVVKVLPPEMAASVQTERFAREIQVAASLQHPHIVPLLTAGSAEGLAWYVMPFIEGETLGTRLEQRGALPVNEAVRGGEPNLECARSVGSRRHARGHRLASRNAGHYALRPLWALRRGGGVGACG